MPSWQDDQRTSGKEAEKEQIEIVISKSNQARCIQMGRTDSLGYILERMISIFFIDSVNNIL